MQSLLPFIILGFIAVLIVMVIAMFSFLVLKDRRDLKAKQLVADMSKLEDVVRDLTKIKSEIMPVMAALKKHADMTIPQIEGQLKQLNNSLSGIDHRQQVTLAHGEKQDEKRDYRGPKPASGKGKGWSNNRPERGDTGYRNDRGDRSDKRKELIAGQRSHDENVSVNDGERYAKIMEMSTNGLSAQDIAKRLNVRQDEVTLVLELKGKKPVSRETVSKN